MALGGAVSKREDARRKRLWKRGASDEAMAKACGISRQAVFYWRRTRGLPANQKNAGKPKKGWEQFGNRARDLEWWTKWEKWAIHVGLRMLGSEVGALVRDEVAQSARIGLMDAIVRFAPRLGKFRSYARRRIQGTILDAARKQGRVPRKWYARGKKMMFFGELEDGGPLLRIPSREDVVRTVETRELIEKVRGIVTEEEWILLQTFLGHETLAEYGRRFHRTESWAQMKRKALCARIQGILKL